MGVVELMQMEIEGPAGCEPLHCGTCTSQPVKTKVTHAANQAWRHMITCGAGLGLLPKWQLLRAGTKQSTSHAQTS